MNNPRMHFVVTGHIDHGKSTFIGRFLLEIGAIATDRFENLKKSSAHRLEYSHLTDALADEKSKGITIGVSQIIFRFKEQECVFLDAPGHHEFLQNMITGASRADLAFLVVDAAEGIKPSTLRHLNMLSFLSIGRIVVVINKMDLVSYSEGIYLNLKNDLAACFSKLGLKFEEAIPVSAYLAENLTSISEKMPWYRGPVVSDILVRSQGPERDKKTQTCRLIVQDVYGQYAVGELLRGSLQTGKYSVHQTGAEINISLDPALYNGERLRSFLYETSGTPLSRGAFLVEAADSARNADRFTSSLLWFSPERLEIGESLQLRLGKQEVLARITAIADVIDSATLDSISSRTSLEKGSVARCEFTTEKNISFDFFTQDADLGRFILLKKGIICGAGKIV